MEAASCHHLQRQGKLTSRLLSKAPSLPPSLPSPYLSIVRGTLVKEKGGGEALFIYLFILNQSDRQTGMKWQGDNAMVWHGDL